ncbi:class I SAM-dependent methyltransferase [Chloroflexia bacterium SDU3-3]|nr:class I SAM-dependent methyltransferase [Chloroflexia bacterium SDU3-3]
MSDRDPTPELLLEALGAPPGQRALVYGGGLALAGGLAARWPGQLLLADTSSARLAQALAAAGPRAAAAGVALPPESYGQFDLAVLAAPQSRALARRWLVEALAALRVGGALYLGGPNDLGIRSQIDDAAALFGGAAPLLARRRARVARAVRPATPPAPPGWAAEPGVALASWASFPAALPAMGGAVALASLPGVFSYDHADPATQLLLAHVGDPRGLRALDLGCGCGIIGVALGLGGAAQVDMLDESLYAVAAAQRNAAALGLAQARAQAADVRAPTLRGPYDLIATNPPFHQGKDVRYDVAHGFIAYASELLAPGGRFLLVANSFLRYESVLRAQFAQVEKLAATPSFTLWQAQGALAK